MTIALDGRWRFRCPNPSKAVPPGLHLDAWMPISIPGTVHHALERLGKIPDPYLDRNELAVQWVDQVDWEFERTITASAADCAATRQQIVFDGIDTVASVELNGAVIGSTVSMFRQLVCDIDGLLRPGKNHLRVLISSPTAYASAQAAAGKGRVPATDFRWQTGEARPSHRAWIRKVQCHFGWDWGVYLATSGIWQGVRLECSRAPRLASVTATQRHRGPVGAPDSVVVTVIARLEASAVSSGELTIALGGVVGTSKARLHRGENTVIAKVTIDDPRLWWPAGDGAQPLYPMTTTWRDDQSGDEVVRKQRLGLRTMELITKADRTPEGKPAEGFLFRVNGRDIYAKGANWIPADQLVDRCTPPVYRHLLDSMVEAHMNMVRVWGGGWYEQDLFYDLCDELGIMVWQDFMMACAIYPDTAGFIRELVAEARYQVRRLSHHCAIALWCGDNEDAEMVWGWLKDRPESARNQKIYTKVLSALGDACREEDPSRRFWFSSPSNGAFGPHNNDPDRGDVHYWTVWHGRQPFSNYLTVKPRFASEFGFQSFPEPRTITAAVPHDQLNPSSRVMEHHQRSPDGNLLITNTMAREMPIPKDFSSFCWVSQINQAMAIRTAVEHWRRLKPWCMGTIYWQVNDLWPVASWSSIDYHGRWKVLHHEAARFYAPLLVSITHDRGRLAVWATSDIPRDLRLSGTLDLVGWDGQRVGRKAFTGKLQAGGSRSLLQIDTGDLLAGCEPHEVCCFATISGEGASASNFATLVPWKWITLPKPRITRSLRSGRGGIELVVSSPQPVPFFHGELEGLEGHFQGDWAVLRPGRSHRLPWRPHLERGAGMPTLAEAKRRLQTLSLYDTYAH